MITDRVQLAGYAAYLKDPVHSGIINLGTEVPSGIARNYPIRSRTGHLNKGTQLEVSGLELLLESDDLSPLFSPQAGTDEQPLKLFSVEIHKEMFPDCYHNPLASRVHNIAGFLDFNEGDMENCRAMEVEGIPTLVSIDSGQCVWQSKEYEFPYPVSLETVAWELALSKLSFADSFNYILKISGKDENLNPITEITIDDSGQMLKANAVRCRKGLGLNNIKRIQVTFIAEVYTDTFLQERSIPHLNEKMGSPLLRAVNFIEPTQSPYVIHSLTELQSISSYIEYFDRPGPQLYRILASIDLNAFLTHSDNDDVLQDKFEFLRLELTSDKFKRFEARLSGEELVRIE